MLKKSVTIDGIRRRIALYLAVLMMLPVLAGLQPIQAEAAASLSTYVYGSSVAVSVVEIEAGQKFYAGDLVFYYTSSGYKTLSQLSSATYKSSKTSVATVGKKTGLVTAKKAGTTTITVTYKSKKATFKLKVVKKGSLGTTTTYKSLNTTAAKISSAFSKTPSSAIKYAFKVSTNLTKYSAPEADWWLTGTVSGAPWCGDSLVRSWIDVGMTYSDGTLFLYVPLSTRTITLDAMYNPLATGSAKAFQVSKMTASVSKNTLSLTVKNKVTATQVAWLRNAYTQTSSSKTFFTAYVYDTTTWNYYSARVYVTAGSKTLTIKLYDCDTGKRVKIVEGHKYSLSEPGFMSITSSKAK